MCFLVSENHKELLFNGTSKKCLEDPGVFGRSRLGSAGGGHAAVELLRQCRHQSTADLATGFLCLAILNISSKRGIVQASTPKYVVFDLKAKGVACSLGCASLWENVASI